MEEILNIYIEKVTDEGTNVSHRRYEETDRKTKIPGQLLTILKEERELERWREMRIRYKSGW